MAKEQSFEEVNKKIDLLAIRLQKVLGEYKKLQSEGKTFAEINDLLGKKINSLSKNVSSLSNATARYGKQLNVTDEQRKITNANLTRAAIAHEKLTDAVNRTRLAQEKGTASSKGFAEGISSAFSPQSIGRAIGSIVKFVTLYNVFLGAINAVKDAIFGSITAFIQFEDSIGKLQAVTGATAEDTKLMSDAIREAAVQTRFTSDEVASLAIELAKLGATSDEIPNLILPIAQAAQAIGADLASVGEAVFKVNNQFGLSAAETAATTQVLVSAINESALSLESFGTAIQYVGPLADQVGLSLNETAAFLQVLSDNGFTASRIGTGLRKIFIDLKKPGEDLSTTLENLAKENISVAEANELVGKTAAAQLITILRNIDAFKDNSDESTRFTSSLKASAAQMSTTAGVVDVLKSSYNDLKISIGDAIVSNESFIEAIGLVFPAAEQLIRGYSSLNAVFSTQKGTEIAKAEFVKLADESRKTGKSVSELGSLYTSTAKILGQTGEANDLIGALNSLTAAGLDFNQAQNAIEIATKRGRVSLNQFLSALGIEGAKKVKINDVIFETANGIDALEDQFVKFEGFTKIVAGQTDELIKAQKVEEERNKTYESFGNQIEKIKKLGPTTEAAGLKAQELEVEIRSKLLKAQQELNDEKSKGILADQDEILSLTGRISGYNKVIQTISEFGNVTDEQAKKDKAAREARAKADIEEIKRRRDNIKDELKRIKEQRDEEIRLAREQSKLLLENQALTVEERAVIENELAGKISDANKKATDAINESILQLGPIYDDAGKAVIKFGKEFPNLVDDLQDSIGDVRVVLGELESQFKTTFLDEANIAIEKSKGVLQTYDKQVAALNEQFGENAGQSKAYFKALEGLTNGVSIELQGFADSLDQTTEEGKIAFQIIQRLLDAIENSGKKAPFNWKKFWKEVITDSLNEALDVSIDAIDRFNEVSLENTRNRLEAQKQLIQNQADIEDDILKARLENQLISEAEYRAQVEKNRKKEAQAQNRIEKQIFDAEQKRQRQSALLDYLSALGSIVPELIKSGNAEPVSLAIKSAITAGFATAGYITELKAINNRQFIPTRFAEGGLVSGPSHAEGGVPFTVRGQGGYEMEGGEYIVNKKSTQKYKSLLDQINGYGKSNYKFATGGVVKDPAQAATRQLELLEAIASSNISMVGKLDKPVRAFVASNDLRSDENARRIQERNSQL
jgi:hypothetical protein